MPSIGETLREARMRQRLDIADVEERTKIRAKYLRALENEEFGMLPGPTFVKTFLRTYAEALGLDPQLLVEEYRTGYESGDEIEQVQSLGPPGVGRDRRRGGPRLGGGSLVLLIAVGIVALLVAIGLASGDGDDGDGEQASGTDRTETQARTQPRREPRRRPRRVVLRIAPVTPTYACLDRGAGTPVFFENTLAEPQTFRGKRLRVNLGKTDVVVTMNGKRVPVESGPNPVGFVFTPRGSRPLPFGQRPCA
jgi:cytoskeleton protein RodZ